MTEFTAPLIECLVGHFVERFLEPIRWETGWSEKRGESAPSHHAVLSSDMIDSQPGRDKHKITSMLLGSGWCQQG